MTNNIGGVYAASITPFGEDDHPDYEQFAAHLKHLRSRGCHGALVGGSTGEAQSLSVDERVKLVSSAAEANTGLRLLAGTGAASLEDAITLTRAAFEHDIAGVVVIPPFFFKNPPEEGLLAFYAELIRRAVPRDGHLLLYHNPVLTSTAISPALIRSLLEMFPEQVVGIKDSSSNFEHTQMLRKEFPELQVLVGDDRHLEDGLGAGGAGAITGLANLFPDMLADVYDFHQDGKPTGEAQARLTEAHHKLDGLPRLAAIKAVLAAGKVIRSAAVRPPLRTLTDAEMDIARDRFNFELKLAQILPPV